MTKKPETKPRKRAGRSSPQKAPERPLIADFVSPRADATSSSLPPEPHLAAIALLLHSLSGDEAGRERSAWERTALLESTSRWS